MKQGEKRKYLELQQAIHEMREGEELHIGEWVFLNEETQDLWEGKEVGYGVDTWKKPFQIIEINQREDGGVNLNLKGVPCYTCNWFCSNKDVRKATEEELTEYFSTTNKIEMKEVYTIREEFLQEAYNAAGSIIREQINENVNWKRECSAEFILKQYMQTCNAWKEKIEKEFPELFEVRDDIAIKKGALNSHENINLNAFCEQAGIPVYDLQVINGERTKEEYNFRGLYIHPNYFVELNRTTNGGTEIIFRKRE